VQNSRTLCFQRLVYANVANLCRDGADKLVCRGTEDEREQHDSCDSKEQGGDAVAGDTCRNRGPGIKVKQ
jgi:hypothetical protein